MDGKQLKNNILGDIQVELKDEFDKNFERKSFFSKAWAARKDKTANGSLLNVTGTLRRSIKSGVSGNGVRFSSSVPYAEIHNEGYNGPQNVKSHDRIIKGRKQHVKAFTRHVNMPQRQFIGDSDETRKIIENVIDDNLRAFDIDLQSKFRKK